MSECGCISCHVDEECGLYNKEQDKYCMEHNEVMCVECERIIDPFIPHVKEVNVCYENLNDHLEPCENSPVEIYRTCHTCKQLRDEFFCDGWYYGNVLDDIDDHIHDMNGDISSECIVNLSPEARLIIFNSIEYFWNQYWDHDDYKE